MTKGERQKSRAKQDGHHPVSLVIPCRPEYISLCRLVAGVIGTREALDEEDIADLKLVVTEACTCYLWGSEGDPPGEGLCAPESPCSLRVEFVVQPETWEIILSDPDHRHHAPEGTRCDSATGTGLSLTIIKALVDLVEHTDTEAEGSVLRLVKHLGPRALQAE